MSYDIVIPVGPNDYDIINKTIGYTKDNVLDYRNIYIVSSLTFNFPGCISIPESLFPFRLEEIAKKVDCLERAGWYLQQLIKLTATTYIKGILDNYLVLDSDVFVLKPIEFFKYGTPFFAYGDEYHIPYFEHMVKLHPSLIKYEPDKSGICHHMLYNKGYLQELFLLVENYRQKPFIGCFLDEVTVKGPHTSGASEYEIYFNFMLKYHPENMLIRQLNWRNLITLEHCSITDDFVAVHHYNRI